VTAQFVNVTEIEGQEISAEQLFRTCHRYHWATKESVDRDVLEVACGAGQGLGLIASVARSVTAGDVSPEVLATAQRVYGDRFPLSVFGAGELPFEDSSFDCVLMFEALYYLNDIPRFFAEVRRVLRPGGKLLIVTANKDLYDFTPSPFSNQYLGVMELSKILADGGYSAEFWALIDTRTVSFRQRALRPVKTLATRLNLMPKTMHGKAWMKRLFFGEMATMPADIAPIPIAYQPPIPIPPNQPDLTHKVIYCCATRN
jgi:ubiquinone/menaquinone biosynthesis C-methylase UbiE